MLVIDLQDVGTRVYTYAWTDGPIGLRAASRCGLRVAVCDRPNPIGGEAVEGPMLDPAFASFVGQLPIPLRHGMTIGELAQLFNAEFGIGADLDVIRLAGWNRSQYHDPDGRSMGAAVAEPADAGQRRRLSRDGAAGGHAAVGGPWDDPVRSSWPAPPASIPRGWLIV